MEIGDDSVYEAKRGRSKEQEKGLHRDRPDRVGVNAGHRVRGEEGGPRGIPPLRGPTRRNSARKKKSGRSGRNDNQIKESWRGGWGRTSGLMGDTEEGNGGHRRRKSEVRK